MPVTEMVRASKDLKKDQLETFKVIVDYNKQIVELHSSQNQFSILLQQAKELDDEQIEKLKKLVGIEEKHSAIEEYRKNEEIKRQEFQRGLAIQRQEYVYAAQHKRRMETISTVGLVGGSGASIAIGINLIEKPGFGGTGVMLITAGIITLGVKVGKAVKILSKRSGFLPGEQTKASEQDSEEL